MTGSVADVTGRQPWNSAVLVRLSTSPQRPCPLCGHWSLPTRCF